MVHLSRKCNASIGEGATVTNTERLRRRRFKRRQFLLWMANVFDVGNLPLMETVCLHVNTKLQMSLGNDFDCLNGRFSRFNLIALVVGPHLWLKVSLAAMSWDMISGINTTNIMLPIVMAFCGKAPAIWSQLHLVRFRCRLGRSNLWRLRREGASLVIACFFVASSLIKLFGIAFCKRTHVLNITSGCVVE